MGRLGQVLVFALALSGCEQFVDPTPSEDVTCDPEPALTTTQVVQAQVIDGACVSCHGPVGPGPIDMSTAALSHENMVGKASETYTGSSALKVVDPHRLATSVFWLKIAGGLRGPKGERTGGVMPPVGEPPLTDEQKKLVKDWICTGATAP